MPVLVKHDVIRLQIPKNYVSLMQIFQGQKYFCQIIPAPVLCKSFVLLKCSRHIATRRVIKQQKQLFRRLKRIIKTNRERVFCVGQHITFSFRILNQVLPQNLLFVEDFHSIELVSGFGHLRLRIYVDLFDQVNNTETALSQFHYCLEIFWPNNFLLLAQFISFSLLPDRYKFVLPFAVGTLGLRTNFDLFSLAGLFFLLISLKSINKHFLVATQV